MNSILHRIQESISHLSEPFHQLQPSMFLLILPTLSAILIVYLQYLRWIPTLFLKSISKPNPIPTTAHCSHCQTLKPIHLFKICSRCQSLTSTSTYFCDQVCQKSNWKTHKLTCGTWNQPQPIDNQLPHGLTQSQLEQKLSLWCEFHRHLLIFGTIHALDLLRQPEQSTQTVYLISLNHHPVHESQSIHQSFSLDQHSPLSLTSFAQANPGMHSALQEMETVREKIKKRGGLGVAMLLVRCGPVVQVIPVGLPSQADLDSVKREKSWKAQFEEAIKAGLQFKAPVRPSA